MNESKSSSYTDAYDNENDENECNVHSYGMYLCWRINNNLLKTTIKLVSRTDIQSDPSVRADTARKLCTLYGGECTMAACCPKRNFAENMCGADDSAVCCLSTPDCDWPSAALSTYSHGRF